MSKYNEDAHKYDDIIHLPHHRSKDRTPISLHDRAAQFAPFAALSGHEEAIEETARFTDEKIILDENAVEKINGKLSGIANCLSEKNNVSVTYFKPDTLKEGGAYLTDVGTIKKVDETERLIIMDSGIKIPMEQIVDISSV